MLDDATGGTESNMSDEATTRTAGKVTVMYQLLDCALQDLRVACGQIEEVLEPVAVPPAPPLAAGRPGAGPDPQQIPPAPIHPVDVLSPLAEKLCNQRMAVESLTKGIRQLIDRVQL